MLALSIVVREQALENDRLQKELAARFIYVIHGNGEAQLFHDLEEAKEIALRYVGSDDATTLQKLHDLDSRKEFQLCLYEATAYRGECGYYLSCNPTLCWG